MIHHKRTLALMFIVAIAIASEGCDHDISDCADQRLSIVGPDDGDGASGISFRDQGPPAGLYITTWNGGPIKRAEFVAAIKACNKQSNPPATLTLSWYQPDTSKQVRVMGLGESIMADEKLWQCYVSVFNANNPVAF